MNEGCDDGTDEGSEEGCDDGINEGTEDGNSDGFVLGTTERTLGTFVFAAAPHHDGIQVGVEIRLLPFPLFPPPLVLAPLLPIVVAVVAASD